MTRTASQDPRVRRRDIFECHHGFQYEARRRLSQQGRGDECSPPSFEVKKRKRISRKRRDTLSSSVRVMLLAVILFAALLLGLPSSSAFTSSTAFRTSAFVPNNGGLATTSSNGPAQDQQKAIIRVPFQTTTTANHLPLYAKPKRNASEQQQALSSLNDLEEIPANLRRKVNAKRPALGHVVPKAFKQKGTGGTSNPRLRPQGKEREAGINNPSMLRISAGVAKGRRLDSPNVYLRPMMGKVKEAVFSTFTSFGLYETGKNGEVSSTRHLDIFAGSGSVGLESLSRGASHCTFVDFSQDCCSAIERNIKWCKFDDDDDPTSSIDNDRARIVCADYLQALRDPHSVGIPDGTKYQLLTLCPPYEEIVYGDLLEAVANTPLVTDDTIVMIEYPIELGFLPHVVKRNVDGEEGGGAMVGIRNRKYGRTVIAMYIVNPTGRLEVAASRPEEFIPL